jgi:hypothetical protein
MFWIESNFSTANIAIIHPQNLAPISWFQSGCIKGLVIEGTSNFASCANLFTIEIAVCAAAALSDVLLDYPYAQEETHY